VAAKQTIAIVFFFMIFIPQLTVTLRNMPAM